VELIVEETDWDPEKKYDTGKGYYSKS